MPTTEITVGALLTQAGLGVVVTIVVQAVFRFWQPTPAMRDRVGPFLAIAVGIVVAVSATVALGFTQRLDYAQAVLNGVLVGGAGALLHDAANAAGVRV